MSFRHLRPLASIGICMGAACYEYVPARDPASLVGKRVQLSLTDSGAVALASQLGPSVEALDGTLLGDSAGAYVVAVATTRMRSGTEMDWRGERALIPRVLTSSLMERTFSSTRSLFAGGLATVGLVGITAGLRGRGAGGPASPVPGKPGSQ